MGVLSVLGLEEDEETVYGALSRRRSASAKELAEALRLPAQRATAALEALRGRGLVEQLVGKPVRWTLAPPEAALEALVHDQQRALAKVTAHAEGIARQVRDLAQQTRPEELISIAEGPAAIGAQFEHLQRIARHEVRALERPPYPRTGGAGGNPLQAQRIAEGITYRAVYDTWLLEDEANVARLRRDAEEGVQGRVMPGVPIKLVVADRQAAIIPLHEGSEGGLSGLVIQPSVLLDSMIEMFEALWLRALPLYLDGQAVPEVDPQVVEIVRLLASGLTDAGIARQLKVSERTVGRRIADALDVLGAASRVQLGMLAERRGWLD